MTSGNSSTAADKPSRNEEEYFVRRDAELLAEARARLAQERTTQEQRSHFMKCPKCGTDLHTVDHHGVQVERCAGCEGIWLDRGELDVLLHAGQEGAGTGIAGRFFQDLTRTLASLRTTS